jgi:hypothetical protein
MDRDEQTRVAFVLSGGASLGAIQAGMLRALYERDIAPDVIVGTSAGALKWGVHRVPSSDDRHCGRPRGGVARAAQGTRLSSGNRVRGVPTGGRVDQLASRSGSASRSRRCRASAVLDLLR